MKTETPQTENVPAVVQPPLVRQSFVDWRNEGRMVIKGQKGTRDPQDGIVKFSRDQTREIPGNLYDDLGHECTDYDGDGY